MSDLTFAIEDWVAHGEGAHEDVATRGFLRVDVGAACLTRNDSSWSQSTSDRVLVSMYPAALWLAANWWRLCWEPRRGEFQQVYEWNASHELAAAGHGYLWPNLRFVADGESVSVIASPTDPASNQPVRYLADVDVDVPRPLFERASSDFIEKVIARLNDLRLAQTELEKLWADVCAERASPDDARARRLEALLGCDPDEGDANAIGALLSLQSEAGTSATDELATVLSGADVVSVLQRLKDASRNGIANIAQLDEAFERELAACRAGGQSSSVPWERGMAAARVLRSSRGVGPDALTDVDLLGLLGLDQRVLQSDPQLDWLPLGLAVRDQTQLRVLLRSRNKRSRRFDLARLVGDLALAPQADRWHPVTGLKTSRQKAQRAFAAELLCPVDGLSRYLGGDRSEDALDAAAEHFDVSTRIVQHQVENHLDW
ncbi:MAG: hypothetical protein HUU28_08930 [Planctomycetaceae bacterium]|nr:hypothetical protein [Planctomycetaceae bacterium]